MRIAGGISVLLDILHKICYPCEGKMSQGFKILDLSLFIGKIRVGEKKI